MKKIDIYNPLVDLEKGKRYDIEQSKITGTSVYNHVIG